MRNSSCSLTCDVRMAAMMRGAMARRGVRTREDLAEQSVDELADIEGLAAEKAAKLIMTARAPWFASEA